MKTLTSIEQSNILKNILDKNSADLLYDGHYDPYSKITTYQKDFVSNWESSYPDRPLFNDEDDPIFIPAWSLSALLDNIPNNTVEKAKCGKYRVYCEGAFTSWYDNPIDAAYEMILKLKTDRYEK